MSTNLSTNNANERCETETTDTKNGCGRIVGGLVRLKIVHPPKKCCIRPCYIGSNPYDALIGREDVGLTRYQSLTTDLK